MAKPGFVAEIDEASCNCNVRRGQRVAPKAERLLRQTEAHGVRPNGQPAVRAHDAATAKPEREYVRHAEVGPYASYHRAFAAAAREAANQHADVRRRAAEKALFLEHPSGRPSAPTPAVKPEIDAGEPLARTVADSLGQPRQRPAEDEDDTRSGPAPSGDIAEAVRRLAERTMEAITPTPEIPLPPGASLVPPEPAVAAPSEPAEAPQLRTSVEIDSARRMVAERVARILERAEQEISEQEAASRKLDVREGFPDFDKPAEKAAPASAARRPVIDDTEVFDPGRDPAVLFAEGERKAKIVNGHARRLGPISGRWVSLAPWIAVLALSVLGLVIGALDTFKTAAAADANAPRAAATLIAVFGVMMLMSVYFIFWNRPSDRT